MKTIRKNNSKKFINKKITTKGKRLNSMFQDIFRQFLYGKEFIKRQFQFSYDISEDSIITLFTNNKNYSISSSYIFFKMIFLNNSFKIWK